MDRDDNKNDGRFSRRILYETEKRVLIKQKKEKKNGEYQKRSRAGGKNENKDRETSSGKSLR